ncbi:MAG TPA: globin [Candidatus Limnocylindrales bacterium]|nr:globin [Candidatus Limnocylindrales bacterium]
MTDEPSLFELAGGMPFFEELVGRFYDGVAVDAVLRPLYPEADLSGARRRLTLFLAQYWGGPTTYGAERGHPRLRMRHAPFAIGPAERDAWLARMRSAIDELDPPPAVADRLRAYIDMAAEAMRNRD